MKFHEKSGASIPVIFIHGLGSRGSIWHESTKVLTDLHRVYVDLPGFGKTPEPSLEKNILRYSAGQIQQLVLEKGWQQVILVGHSYGGAVASEAAHLLQEKVAGLILVATAGYPSHPRLVKNYWYHKFKDRITSLGAYVCSPLIIFTNRGSRVFQNLVFDHTLLTQDQKRELIMAISQSRARTRARQSLWASTLRDRLGQLTTPMYIIWGKQDRVISHHLAEIISQAPSHQQTILYNNAGHIPFMEAPDFTAALSGIILKIQAGLPIKEHD